MRLIQNLYAYNFGFDFQCLIFISLESYCVNANKSIEDLNAIVYIFDLIRGGGYLFYFVLKCHLEVNMQVP